MCAPISELPFNISAIVVPDWAKGLVSFCGAVSTVHKWRVGTALGHVAALRHAQLLAEPSRTQSINGLQREEGDQPDHGTLRGYYPHKTPLHIQSAFFSTKYTVHVVFMYLDHIHSQSSDPDL